MKKRMPLEMEMTLYQEIVRIAKKEHRNVSEQIRYMCAYYLKHIYRHSEPIQEEDA